MDAMVKREKGVGPVAQALCIWCAAMGTTPGNIEHRPECMVSGLRLDEKPAWTLMLDAKGQALAREV